VVIANLNGADQQGTKSFAETLAPIWEGWRQSGMTEGEVDGLFEQELREADSRQAHFSLDVRIVGDLDQLFVREGRQIVRVRRSSPKARAEDCGPAVPARP
jgi:hypothetical protein